MIVRDFGAMQHAKRATIPTHKYSISNSVTKLFRLPDYGAPLRPLIICTAACYCCHQLKGKGGICHDTLGDTRHWIFGFLLISRDWSGTSPVRRRLDHTIRWQKSRSVARRWKR